MKVRTYCARSTLRILVISNLYKLYNYSHYNNKLWYNLLCNNRLYRVQKNGYEQKETTLSEYWESEQGSYVLYFFWVICQTSAKEYGSFVDFSFFHHIAIYILSIFLPKWIICYKTVRRLSFMFRLCQINSISHSIGS